MILLTLLVLLKALKRRERISGLGDTRVKIKLDGGKTLSTGEVNIMELKPHGEKISELPTFKSNDLLSKLISLQPRERRNCETTFLELLNMGEREIFTFAFDKHITILHFPRIAGRWEFLTRAVKPYTDIPCRNFGWIIPPHIRLSFCKCFAIIFFTLILKKPAQTLAPLWCSNVKQHIQKVGKH